MDKGTSNLLQWAIANQNSDNADQSGPTQQPRGLNEDAIRALMGGPSDADLMKQAMGVVVHPEATLDAKITAFDNFEQLIENLDNANNMIALGLWEPLMAQLTHDDAEIRKMAAWCVGTAVQNNESSQKHLLKIEGVPKICRMATEDRDQGARRKAVYALSSTVRNNQRAMDEAVRSLPSNIVGPDQVSASDMDVIDAIMSKLREA